MKYILIGTLLGSFIHSDHDSKELCMGRKALLEEKGAVVKCVESPQSINSFVYGGTGLQCCTGITCGSCAR